jgi:hypothetical protein
MRDVEQRVVVDAHIQLWLDHGSATAAQPALLSLLRSFVDHSSGRQEKSKGNQRERQQEGGRRGPQPQWRGCPQGRGWADGGERRRAGNFARLSRGRLCCEVLIRIKRELTQPITFSDLKLHSIPPVTNRRPHRRSNQMPRHPQVLVT